MTDCVDEASVRQILLKAKPDAFVSMMQVDQMHLFIYLFYLYLVSASNDPSIHLFSTHLHYTQDDQLNYDACELLQRKFDIPRCVVQCLDPAWSERFMTLGTLGAGSGDVCIASSTSGNPIRLRLALALALAQAQAILTLTLSNAPTRLDVQPPRPLRRVAAVGNHAAAGRPRR